MANTLEQKARQDIDITAGRGIAIRKYPMKSGIGFSDYLLYADRKAIRAVVYL